MRLYFVRHGLSEANVQQIFSNRGFKHPLTEAGQRQAQALADLLKTAGLTYLYTSPLMRAVQTAEYLSAACGIPVRVTDALREYDCGVLEDTPTVGEGMRIYLTVWDEWMRGNVEARIEGGESLADIRARFVPFIEQLVQDYADTDTQIALVGHGGTFRAALPYVLSNVTNTLKEIGHMGNAEYALAEWRDNRLICLSWCGRPVSA